MLDGLEGDELDRLDNLDESTWLKLAGSVSLWKCVSSSGFPSSDMPIFAASLRSAISSFESCVRMYIRE